MSYRSRLVLYVGMLVVLLVGMMALSFKAARDVIVTSTQQHLSYIASHQSEVVESQFAAVQRNAGLMAEDQRLLEYLREPDPNASSAKELVAHYVRRFALLPGDSLLILSATGEVQVGAAPPTLVAAVRQRSGADTGQAFYLDTPHGVLMSALQPIVESGRRRGTVLLTRLMDQRWLSELEPPSSDYLLFFERRGRVTGSSNPRFKDARVDVRSGRLRYRGQTYRMESIPYAPPGEALPGLWFGTSDANVTGLLASYQRWVFAFAALGSLAVALVGWLVLRNFSRPMAALMQITAQMIKGELPVMVRSDAKSEMDSLVNRFADVIDSLRREQSKLETANRKLQETAITDSLTGLYNRRYLQEVTPGLFAQVVRDQRYLTAVLMDLDYFKAINDSWGHLGGDAVLVHFAQLLQHNSRANDFLFRIGGEEFLLLNVAETPRDSVALAEKIRELVSRSPASYQGSSVTITVSIGVSCCYGKTGDVSLSTLMRAADKSLYEAKSSGRNCVVLHASCREATADRPKSRPRIALVKSGENTKPQG